MGKTGTTTLQNSVFQHHSEICYLGKSLEYLARGTRRGFASNILAQRLEPMLLNGKRLNARQKDQLEKDLSELSEDNPSAKIVLGVLGIYKCLSPRPLCTTVRTVKDP